MHDHSTSPKGTHGLKVARRALAAAALVAATITAGWDVEIASTQSIPAAENREPPVRSIPVRAEPASLKLGPVQPGKRTSGVIKLINASDRPINLAKLSASCGCTTITPAAKVIPPLSAVEVTVELHASARHGAQMRKTITVIFEDDLEPLRIPVEASVEATVLMVPESLSPAALDTSKLFLSSTDDEAFRITATIPVITGLALPSGPSGRHELAVRYQDWIAAGSPSLLRFIIDHPSQPEVSLRLAEAIPSTGEKPGRRVSSSASAAFTQAMSITPRRLNFGIVPARSSLTRTVVLKDAAQMPACDPLILAESGDLSIEMTQWRRQGADVLLDLTLKAGAPTGARLREELTIQYGETIGTVTIYAHPR